MNGLLLNVLPTGLIVSGCLGVLGAQRRSRGKRALPNPNWLRTITPPGRPSSPAGSPTLSDYAVEYLDAIWRTERLGGNLPVRLRTCAQEGAGREAVFGAVRAFKEAFGGQVGNDEAGFNQQLRNFIEERLAARFTLTAGWCERERASAGGPELHFWLTSAAWEVLDVARARSCHAAGGRDESVFYRNAEKWPGIIYHPVLIGSEVLEKSQVRTRIARAADEAAAIRSLYLC